MPNQWAISGVDLHLDLAGPRLREGLERALRDAVRSGRLRPGTRLPSSRSLAQDLGVARNTVAEAYAAAAEHFSQDELAALISLIVAINAWNAIGVATHAWVPGSYEA